MPQATIKGVISVSSEDLVHSASNLLAIKPGKKWRTSSSGEKTAHVVLELAQPETITGIDIGNEHSAFVEVLVGRTRSSDEFKEILMTCSFMTPIESKNSTNTNRVRCFEKVSLLEDVVEQKWNLIKIVCTQPFNRHVQYGLSFIKLHVLENPEIDSSKPKTLVPPGFLLKQLAPHRSLSDEDRPSILGKFKLREDSPDSDTDGSASLFKRWKQSKTSTTDVPVLSTASAIRVASNSLNTKNQSSTTSSTDLHKITKPITTKVSSSANHESKPIKDRNRDDICYDKDDDVGNEKLEKRITEDAERFKQEKLSKTNTISKKKEEKKKLDTSTSNKFSDFLDYEDNDKTSSSNHKNRDSDRHTSEKNNNSKDEKGRTHKADVSKKGDISIRDKAEASTSKYKKEEKSREKDVSTEKSKKRPSTPTKHDAKKPRVDKPTIYRPFNKLLEGVVLVISGIQNPERGIIRQKAIDLGSKYKPDWDDSCTHLICAFKNTPKYNYVKGKGKIVLKSWIEKCHTLKKRLPWRRYAVDDKESEKMESEDEIHDISLKPPDIEDSDDKSPKRNLSPKPFFKKQMSFDETLSQYDLGKKRSTEELSSSSFHNDVTSGSDTEEEIERIQKIQANLKKRNNNNESEKIYDVEHMEVKNPKGEDTTSVFELSTDNDDEVLSNNLNNKEREIFEEKKFFICETVSSVDKIKLKQYIKQYKGVIVNSIENSEYALSKDKIKTPSEYKGEIVDPLWIFECNDMECFIPTRRYLK